MDENKDKRSIFEKDDTSDRMYYGKGGFGLFLAAIAIIYIIYNIIVNS
ncbi:MAG: hypothetical protein ACK4M9_22455 [Anaerobacillus sp.]